MRIVQLIDSLEAGGAERMAVNYANALAGKVPFSGLVVTRAEGGLKAQLDSKVNYLFLNKKAILDVRAVLRLRNYLKTNRVAIIHAHSSSFFLAVVVKIIYPTIKVVWHDHNGNRLRLPSIDNRRIVKLSSFFSGAIACNTDLERWAKEHLKTQKVIYLPNFATVSKQNENITFLKGSEGKRIVCLANLRTPKNHITLLKVFERSKALQSGWTLHLVGKDRHDAYSIELKNFIKEHGLEQNVFIYGSCTDVSFVLQQSNIGVLLSTSEGFPVTLLEYGLASLCVLSTNVGYCPEVITEEVNGFLVSPKNSEQILFKLDLLTENKALRNKFSVNLNSFVTERFSEKAVIDKALDFFEKI